MEYNFMFSVENLLKNNNEGFSLISDISSQMNINIDQTQLIIKYLKRFHILSSLLDSKYMNYFNDTNLFDLRENNEMLLSVSDESIGNKLHLKIAFSYK